MVFLGSDGNINSDQKALSLRRNHEKSSGYACVTESGFPHCLLKQRCRQRCEATTEGSLTPFFQRRPISTVGSCFAAEPKSLHVLVFRALRKTGRHDDYKSATTSSSANQPHALIAASAELGAFAQSTNAKLSSARLHVT